MAVIVYQPEPDFQVGQAVPQAAPETVPETVTRDERPSLTTIVELVVAAVRMLTPSQAGAIALEVAATGATASSATARMAAAAAPADARAPRAPARVRRI